MLIVDSSTSEGWACKTNCKEDREDHIKATVRIEVASGNIKHLMDAPVKDYSQWFLEKENDVSDALSRIDDRDDDELTQILHTFVPSQVPKHFRIVLLPKEIFSWLIPLL